MYTLNSNMSLRNTTLAFQRQSSLHSSSAPAGPGRSTSRWSVPARLA